MKVYGKWLVKAYGENVKVQGGVVSSFMTKKEAIDALDALMTPLNDGTWKSAESKAIFKIEKNTKEYR